MIRKTITYTDFNDLERKEDFYFHMSEAELNKQDLKHGGKYADYLQKLADAKDFDVIADVIEELILRAYGIKSEDGRRFEKSDDISASFYQSPAYDVLFAELAQDPKNTLEFFKGVIPKNLSAVVEEELKKNPELLKSAKV